MTKIRRTSKALQVLPGENKVLYHSNRVSRGRYLGMTQLQMELFIEIMIKLQQPIKRSMEGKKYQDLLEIVPEEIIENEQYNDEMDVVTTESSQVKIGIPLKDIASPNNYDKVITAAKTIGNVWIELKSEDEKYKRHRAFITGIDELEKENGRRVLYVYVPISVAKKLIEIDRNVYGKPVRYTSYLLNIVRKAKKCKYTVKMYWLISSWKSKKEIKIQFEELKKELCIDDQYKKYYEFKRRILIPVQEELKELNSDCWFEVEEERDNKKVSYLIFKIFSNKKKYKSEEFSKKIKAGLEIKQLLAEKFNFEAVHMTFFDEKIRTHKNYHEDKCLYKIKSIMKWLEKPLNRMEVVNLPDYMLTSLAKFFYQEKKMLELSLLKKTNL